MTVARIGRVEILAHLGDGAGSRLRVRRAADGREYALKLVPVRRDKGRKYLAQARQEFRVAGLLDHPHLVRVYSFEAESDWLFRVKRAKLLCEYVPGATLDKECRPTNRMLLRVFEQVAAAVAHMHDRGVVHADLKPNNIIVGPGGAKVIDFGLSRVGGEGPGRVQATREYMAPETALLRVVDERSDVFNFGAAMYRMFTFNYPPSPVAGRVVGSRPGRPLLRPVAELNPRAPAALCELIHQCLSDEPGDRPARMAGVRVVLKQLADESAARGDPA